MRVLKQIICFLVLSMLMLPSLSSADDREHENRFEVISSFAYPIAPEDSRNVYESLSLFGAKYKAVLQSAKYLNHAGVLKDYGSRSREIFFLAAAGLEVQILKSGMMNPGRFNTRIKAVVRLEDFTRAEIRNIELEKREEKFSWQEEMEQYIDQTIEPGREISRAYRYFRKKDWRIGIIFLDHLQKKYPGWDEIYAAKAIGFYALNKTEAMALALKKACELGSREACEDLEGFSGRNEKIKIN